MPDRILKHSTSQVRLVKYSKAEKNLDSFTDQNCRKVSQAQRNNISGKEFEFYAKKEQKDPNIKCKWLTRENSRPWKLDNEFRY